MTENKNLSGWKMLGKKTLYNKRFRVVEQDVVLPTGKKTSYDIIEMGDFVGILPVTPSREVVVVSEFRPAYGKVITTIPLGNCNEGEKPEETALRELEEETGYRAGKMVFLGTFCPFAGRSAVKVHLYLATDLKKGEKNPDENEFIQVSKIPLEKAFQMVEKNESQHFALPLALLLSRSRRLL